MLRGVDLSPGRDRSPPSSASTGAGKTTLLNLIPRLFDATGGAVLVDGVDVRELDPALLARTVGLVPQRPYLFSGTVASNLRYGNPDATDDQLWRALEVAQARDFVSAMDEGLDAPIAQGGTNVSGGQRQRLAIARMLVREAGDLPVRRLVLGARLRHGRRAARRARARDGRRDRRHRRPARVDDPRRRPHRRAERRPRRRHRHARGAHGRQRDVPRNCPVAVDREGGGGGMSAPGSARQTPNGHTPKTSPNGYGGSERRRAGPRPATPNGKPSAPAVLNSQANAASRPTGADSVRPRCSAVRPRRPWTSRVRASGCCACSRRRRRSSRRCWCSASSASRCRCSARASSATPPT